MYTDIWEDPSHHLSSSMERLNDNSELGVPVPLSPFASFVASGLIP